MYSKDAGKDQMLMTMERALTSGQKAGFFFLGFLGGIVGILAASLMNINAPYRPEGTKMAALGFATACVLGTLIALVGFIALLGARGGKILKDFLNQRPAFFQLHQSVRVR